MSAMETFANNVTREVAGGVDEKEVVRGFDLASIAILVMQVVIEVLKNCPAPAARIIDAAKKPRMLQKARFAALVSSRCCDHASDTVRQNHSRIAIACLSVASQTNETELLAIINEAKSDNLLV